MNDVRADADKLLLPQAHFLCAFRKAALARVAQRGVSLCDEALVASKGLGVFDICLEGCRIDSAPPIRGRAGKQIDLLGPGENHREITDAARRALSDAVDAIALLQCAAFQCRWADLYRTRLRGARR